MLKINKNNIVYIVLVIIIVIAIYIFFINDKDNYFIEEKKLEENNNDLKEDELDKEKVEVEDNKKIIVYVAGAVKNDGVYSLEENSRIADAIEKAGGLKDNAYIKDINLAYVISDGMKIYIPFENEKSEDISDNTDNYIYNEDTDFNKKETIKSKIKININTATQTELETLPGIGPSLALSIIDYRKNNGKFKSIEEIQKVSGIGENKFLKIKNFIVV